MTYPPGNPGYPPASPTTQYGNQSAGAAPQSQQSQPSGQSASSKLPGYLTIATAVLGFVAFVSSFGPVATVEANFGGGGATIAFIGFFAILSISAAALAGAFAAATVLPRQRNYTAVAAAFAVVAFLLALAQLPNVPQGFSTAWGLILLLASTGLLAVVAVVALLFDAGVITPPQPKPQYDPYGQYGAPGQYYGPPSGALPAQRPGGYGQQYGGYLSTGGFTAQGGQHGGQSQGGQPGSLGAQGQHAQQSGSATPPTGFPTFGQPHSGSAQHAQPQSGGQSPGAPTQQIPSATQQPNQPPS